MAAPRSAIVGIHEYPLRLTSGVSALQIKAASAAAALDDAGLTWSDVDALYDCNEAVGRLGGLHMGEYFGLKPGIHETTMVGGSSYEVHAGHARDEIAAGRARVALLTYGSLSRSGGSNIATGGPAAAPLPAENMETLPWGVNTIAYYAMAAMRHMYQYGTTPQQLAEIAVVARAHAMRNPDAVQAMNDLRFRDIGELTVDAVLSSTMVSDPLHRLECCMVSDGGGAIVIAADDVARDTRHAPVWILGAGEGQGYPENDGDVTVTGAVQSGARAFGEAGVSPSEIDITMLYDSFTITVMTALEDLGFCAKGDGGSFVADGRLRFDSPLRPSLNTDGGGLFSNHPGMRGLFLLIEATRQLRGDSTSQVDEASLAVCHGNGGLLSSRHVAGTVVLGR